jgi:hypothetical protein
MGLGWGLDGVSYQGTTDHGCLDSTRRMAHELVFHRSRPSYHGFIDKLARPARRALKTRRRIENRAEIEELLEILQAAKAEIEGRPSVPLNLVNPNVYRYRSS